MQDKYVGDIGDFGKYGLLRWLCREDDHSAKLRLGVLWYRFDGKDAGASEKDGGFIQYLGINQNPGPHGRNLRCCDRDLYKKLRDVVKSNRRCIAAVESGDVLPHDTLFYSKGLNFDGVSQKQKTEKRHNWLNLGLDTVENANIVFYDPDNGLQVKSYSRTSSRGPKYVFYNELKPCWDKNKSLVIYQHLNQNKKAEEQAKERCEELRKHLRDTEILVLQFHRWSSRFFFILAQPEHVDRLKARVSSFLASPWGSGSDPHFTRVEC